MVLSLPKSGRLLALLGYRIKLIIKDGRAYVGIFLAFDKHMNLVVGDVEEFRDVKKKKDGQSVIVEERRAIGLMLMRGETIVSLSVEGPPARQSSRNRMPASQKQQSVMTQGSKRTGAKGSTMPPPPPPGQPPLGLAAGTVLPPPPLGMMPPPPGMPPLPPGMMPPPPPGFRPPPPPGFRPPPPGTRPPPPPGSVPNRGRGRGRGR
eukprot:Clim_evm97s243 gene=Clim_evmTU97s243